MKTSAHVHLVTGHFWSVNRPSLLLALTALLLAGACKTASKTTSASSPKAVKENVLSLQPGADNPRNSEGSFVTLKDGSILFVYSRYTGNSTSDYAPAYLASRISKDGGKTWSQADEKVVALEGGGMNLMSVSLLRLKNGSLALFYLKKNSKTDCLPLMRTSTDEAKTWSEPVVCITDKKGYFVLNNDRVIQLSGGRLLMAVAMHESPGMPWSNKGKLYSYYSDDNGASWTSGTEVPTPDSIITQEPGVVELKNGHIMMFIRASGNYQLLSYSKDKGQTWSMAERSNIASPLSPATIERIPGKGDLLLVWNNNDGSQEAIKGKRTPFNLAVSSDEGKTWEHMKTLESDPDGWYCYTALHFVNNDVLIANCAGSRSKKTELSVTNITRVSLDWIYE